MVYKSVNCIVIVDHVGSDLSFCKIDVNVVCYSVHLDHARSCVCFCCCEETLPTSGSDRFDLNTMLEPACSNQNTLGLILAFCYVSKCEGLIFFLCYMLVEKFLILISLMAALDLKCLAQSACCMFIHCDLELFLPRSIVHEDVLWVVCCVCHCGFGVRCYIFPPHGSPSPSPSSLF